MLVWQKKFQQKNEVEPKNEVQAQIFIFPWAQFTASPNAYNRNHLPKCSHPLALLPTPHHFALPHPREASTPKIHPATSLPPKASTRPRIAPDGALRGAARAAPDSLYGNRFDGWLGQRRLRVSGSCGQIKRRSRRAARGIYAPLSRGLLLLVVAL